MARRKAPHLPDLILDQLLVGADAKTMFEADGVLGKLKKALQARRESLEIVALGFGSV